MPSLRVNGEYLTLSDKKYRIVSNISAIDHSQYGDALCTLIIKDTKSPSKNYQTLRILQRGSHPCNDFESHIKLLKRAAISSPNAHILTPIESFDILLEGTATLCLLYDELIGPTTWFLLNDLGYESCQLPAQMISKIAYQSLQGLALLQEQNIACRLHWATLTLTYQSERFTTDEDIIQFFGQDRDICCLNETATGPEDSEFELDSFNVKLDLLQNDAYQDLVDRDSGFPPEMYFDKIISPAADIWVLGDVLTNQAAQSPFFYNLIAADGEDAISRLLLSRELLGELPREYLGKVPKAGEYPLDFKEDTMFLRIRDNKLVDMAREDFKFTDPQLRQFVALLKRMLTYSPTKRITARQALDHEFFKDYFHHGKSDVGEDNYNRSPNNMPL